NIKNPPSNQYFRKIIHQLFVEERHLFEQNINKWIQQNIKIELKLNNSKEKDFDKIMKEFEEKIIKLFKKSNDEQERKLEEIKLQIEEVNF
uniref:Uncharacterized protein n=1 Tax=Meloidogyne hapla TaxID=6305 RepID=A0A1I8BBR1_MELHA